jgi:hypothetical protein
MNCVRCNAPLVSEARFCRNCGLPVAPAAPPPIIANLAQANQPVLEDSPTVVPQSNAPVGGARSFVPQDKFTAPEQPQFIAPAPTQPASLQSQHDAPQLNSPQPYQPTVAVSPGSLPSTGTWPSSPAPPKRRRKNRLVRSLLLLAVVLLVLAAGWFFGLRPYLHGLAQNQIDGVLSNTLDQINPPVDTALIPPVGVSIPVSETALNNLIVLNTAPSDPVQQMHVTITPAGLRVDFQAYGFPCTVTGVPQAANGQLVITNVTVQGIVSLIMSPDELTSTLNTHLSEASAKLHNNISGVLLKDHEVDVQLR